jgi:phosphoglycerate dehydrogenase-like enzyme
MFRVGLTRDFLTPQGALTYRDIGLDILDDADGLTYEFMKEYRSPVTADMLGGYDAVISLAPAYNAESFRGVGNLKAICRFGVGYDMVDLKSCTEAGVAVTITRGAVNYSVAEAVVTWMLALSHRLVEKNNLVRSGGWSQRSNYMGTELRGRTLGIIGIGGIGGRLVEMLGIFGMAAPLAFDPYADSARAAAMGVELVALDYLLQHADFISVNCPLTDETRNLVNESRLALVKKNAYIINTARGGIINEEALVSALNKGAFAGYATDVFATEPPPADHPFFTMENVLLAPHCIAWTHDMFSEIGRRACQQVVEVSQGKVPGDVVNKEVLDKWQHYTSK